MGNHRFIVTTTKPIRKGEEVFVSYGKNTEEKFLELYGFL
jgi:SET domain-containing protein